MRAEWQAHIDQLLETYREKRQQLQGLQEALEEIEGAGEAVDGQVRARVDRQGRLTKLEIDPRVFRRLGSEELAEAVRAASDAAAADAAAKVRAATAAVMPAGAGDGEGGVDLSKLLSAEVPTDIEGVKRRYGLLDR